MDEVLFMPRVEFAPCLHMAFEKLMSLQVVPVTERLSVNDFVTLVHDSHKTDFMGFFSFCF